jgi:hypothetical protein
MLKRYLAIGGVVIILAGLGLMWWLDREAPAVETATIPTTDQPIFPVGDTRDNPGINLPPAATSTEIDNNESRDPSGRFVRISSKPVGGAAIIGTGTSSALVYVERATGHLYRFRAEAGGAERISNTTIPRVYQLSAGMSGTSTRIAFQYLKEGQVQSFLGQYNLDTQIVGDEFLTPSSNVATSSKGEFLPSNISSLSLNAKTKQTFWLERGANELVGYLADWNGQKKEAVWRSAHPEWSATWASSTTIALLTKPSADTNGSLYYFNTKDKKTTPVITNVPGLTALVSPKLDQVLYSAQGPSGVVTGFYDTKDRFFGRFEIQTWADKCVWEHSGAGVYCAVPTLLPNNFQYPDSWYRGEVTTSDNIWHFDLATNRSEIIFNPTQAGLRTTIDADNLLLSDNNKTLYLTNRNTQQLWGLNLQTAFVDAG